MSSEAPPPLGERLFALVEPAQLMAWAMSRKFDAGIHPSVLISTVAFLRMLCA